MNYTMFAQLGLELAGGVADAQMQGVQYKMQQASQAYTNTLSALSTAQQQNAVTLNEIALQDADAQTQQAIDIQSMQDRGAARVAAAAAGVAGNSVALTLQGLAASSAIAQKNRVDNLKAQYDASNQQRRNIAVTGIYNKDISIIPKPSAADALLGRTTNMLDIWDSHQTPGNKIKDILSKY